MSVCPEQDRLAHCLVNPCLSWGLLGSGHSGNPSPLHRVVQKQMAFMLGRHGVFLELNEDVEEYEDLTEIMSNVQLNSNFLALAREVSVSAGKSTLGYLQLWLPWLPGPVARFEKKSIIPMIWARHLLERLSL